MGGHEEVFDELLRDRRTASQRSAALSVVFDGLLDGLPLLLHLSGAARHGIAEDVGVAPYELVLDVSKEIFVGELALLGGDLWLENAAHANRMARLLAEEVESIASIRITRKVQTNVVFAQVPREQIPVLQKERFFYVWNDAASEVRWMTSFDTTPEDIHTFVTILKETLGS